MEEAHGDADAPPTTIKGAKNELSLAHANRSAALMQMKQWKQALVDIECAFQHGYPPEKHERLHKRRQECLEALGKLKDGFQ